MPALSLGGSVVGAPAVGVAAYRAVTKDNDTDDDTVAEALATALGLVEEYLGRPLSFGTHTERLRLYSGGLGIFGEVGRVRPRAYPVVSVSVPAGTQVMSDRAQVRMVAQDDDNAFMPAGLNERYATVTYQGGYTEETLPATIRRAVIWLARQETAGVVVPTVQPGVTMERAGDVARSFGSKSGEEPGEVLPAGMRKALRPFRYRDA